MLGDKEARTRDPVTSKVEGSTKELYVYCRSLGIDTFFEMNEGNHFKDAALRTSQQ